MTRSKLGKRVLAFLFALCLVVNLALYPLRARAMAGALTVASAGVVVTAALMASGIYPYEQQKQFAEYVTGNLAELWDDYLEWREGNTISPEDLPPNSLQELTGFVTSGSIVVTRKVWNALSDFVTWIRDKFSVADNQTGIQLGSGPLAVPVIQNPTYTLIRDFGLLFGRDGDDEKFVAASRTGFYAAAFSVGSNVKFMVAGIASQTQGIEAYYYGGSNYFSTQTVFTKTYKGVSIRWACDFYEYPAGYITFDSAIPRYASESEFLDALLSDTGTFTGITADTTTVVPLEPLPADTEWGGFQVAGTSNPDGTIETIEQGVTAREKPVVRPVEVEIQQGTEVDTETGEVTENPIVITPEDVVPTVVALSPPASFLSALQTTMTTKFPFCLPFDLFKILQAFYVAPEAPVFYLSFHDPFSNSDFSITVDLSPWDEVAAVARNFEAMILLAGFCLNFDKFNVIHLILGGLG